ncbi:hypothetical protein PRIC1_010041 [Phytophthora ramorum]
MNDVELSALWNFLAELNTDEIFEGVGSSKVDENDTICWDESSVASFSSDDTNDTISSDDDMATVVANCRPTKNRHTKKATTSKKKVPASVEMRRAQQKKYDKNWKERRKVRIATGTRVLVAGLKLLNALLEDRLERTRTVTMTMRLLQVGKEDQKFSELLTAENEGNAQLALNLETFKYIDLWTTTWIQTKDEQGKFFLKQTVPEIDFQIENLVQLGEKLTESVKELDWCMRQKTGAWV